MTGYGQKWHRFHHCKRPLPSENQMIDPRSSNIPNESSPTNAPEAADNLRTEADSNGSSEKSGFEHTGSGRGVRDEQNEQGR